MSKQNNLAKKIVLRYLFSLFVAMAILTILIVISVIVATSFVWQPYDPIYIILNIIWDNFFLFVPFFYIASFVAITCYFLVKTIRYLNEIVKAYSVLSLENSEKIKLSPSLIQVEEEMNIIRENSIQKTMMAKDAEKRKNDLIVYLAHDLKTPLTSIIGYLTLLTDEPSIALTTRMKYLNIVLNKSQRLEDLINEFFEITRFNLSTHSLQKEKVNLSVMLEQIAYEFQPVLAECDLSLDLEIEDNLFCNCDVNKIERVFDNLIKNAINYSYANSIIEISLYKFMDNIKFKIVNSGKTIEDIKLIHIFDQFYRTDESRSASTGGTGLGLAISKEIIELHNGSITASSEDDKIEFIVTLSLV